MKQALAPRRSRGLGAWVASASLALLVGLALPVGLAACGKKPQAPPDAAAPAGKVFKVLAGSEVRDLEPALKAAANSVGLDLQLSYAGTLDIVERVNAGEAFDAMLPANGAYPSLALTKKPLAREKLFYSRVALGVKQAKAQALGWTAQAPSWADIAKAAGSGGLRFAMTNPTSSNTGMSALFAVASAVAGKTEDLTVQEVDGAVLKAFLSGQKLSAGSSGWLAEAFIKDPSALDAMVNYEAVILRTNEKLATADQLTLIYPKDGVISADYPLMLLTEARRDDYMRLVGALKAPALQGQLSAQEFVRPAVAEVPLGADLPAAAVVELSFPNRLEVIDAVLGAYQGDWRRPATSIFVLDTSGSMKGERLEAMRAALKILAGADASSASARYTRFQSRENVVLIAFSDRVEPPVRVSFEPQSLGAARQQVLAYADALRADGGTGIYAALQQAQTLAAAEQKRDPQRYISVVLLTDGENTAGPDLAAFKSQLGGSAAARVFPILFGEASNAEMATLAQITGGRVFDGRKAALSLVFKDIRGYQ